MIENIPYHKILLLKHDKASSWFEFYDQKTIFLSFRMKKKKVA